MKVLVVVDMQNDFVDGALGTKEACAIVSDVVKAIEGFEGQVVATRDTHAADYMDTQEGRHLPVIHCVKGTEGWKINQDVQRALDEKHADLIDKPTFGSVELGEYMRKLDREEKVEEILLVGVCTDICVISNALLLKAYLPEVPVRVMASCCAGVTPESHARALEAMGPCQIEVI